MEGNIMRNVVSNVVSRCQSGSTEEGYSEGGI